MVSGSKPRIETVRLVFELPQIRDRVNAALFVRERGRGRLVQLHVNLLPRDATPARRRLNSALLQQREYLRVRTICIARAGDLATCTHILAGST